MFILPVMKDHLSWETKKSSGRFIQVSLYQRDRDVVVSYFWVINGVDSFGDEGCIYAWVIWAILFR